MEVPDVSNIKISQCFGPVDLFSASVNRILQCRLGEGCYCKHGEAQWQIGGLHPKIFKVPCVLHIWKLHIYLVCQSWFAMLQVNLSEGKACLNIRSNFKYPAVSDMKSNGILLVNTDYWFKISCGFLYAFALQPCPQPLRKHPKKERHLVYWPKNKKDRPASYLIQDSFDIVKGWLCPLCPVKRDI